MNVIEGQAKQNEKIQSDFLYSLTFNNILNIIVMLILVAVSISIAINNGLFKTAGNAVKDTKTAGNAEQELAGGQVKIDNQIYSSVEEYLGTVGGTITSDGSFDGKINTPKLTADMTPVAWDKNGNEYVPTTNERWYNYEENKWANAKTEDGSYWVWIPRYEYKITPPAEGEAAGTIDINFITRDTKSGSTGYTTEDGITTSSDNHIIHPAFTNSVENGGWDSELAGFWVAKYEMSMEGKTEGGKWTSLEPTTYEDSTTEINGNVGTTNTITAYNQAASEENQLSTSVTDGTSTYTEIRAVSKPNVSSWRYINISNCYENSYYYDRNKESHLMKNSEWGAVAYLTHSKYGRNGAEVTRDGTEYITAVGGVTTSSTGNETGIYDLAGGTPEYVSKFNDTYTAGGVNSYSTTDKRYKSSIGTNIGAKGLANGGSTKYLTAYTTTLEIEEGEEKIKASIVGDAIKEIYVKNSKGWFSDILYMGNEFNMRGGKSNATDARYGIFCLDYGGGVYGKDATFRIVCNK